MRIAGISGDEDGNSLFLIDCRSPSGKSYRVLFEEETGEARLMNSGEAESLFAEGILEPCSFPASEVFFPDEIAFLAGILPEEDQKEVLG